MEKTAKPIQPPKPAPQGISYEASLIFSLSLLVVLTGLTISLIAFNGTRKGTMQLAHDLFREVSDHAVTQTRDFLERAVPISRVLGDLTGLGLATDDHDQLARQLLVVLRASDGVSWVSYGDEAGNFVGAYRTRSGQLRINQSRIEPSGKTTVIEHDILPDGAWKLFRKDQDSAYDPRARPYYIKAKQAGRIVWTEPYVFYDQAIPGVTCANPVFGKDGKLKGVITVDFDLDTLTRFVERQTVGANSRLFIMTPDGILLAHPVQQRMAEAAEQNVAQTRARSRGKGELLKVGELNDPLLNTFMDQLTAEDRSTSENAADHARQFEFELSGTRYFARATAFSVSGDLVWIVGAVAPQTDFLASAWRTNALATSASLGAMLIAVIVAMLLARRVSGPVRSLVSFMDSVRAGDLTKRLRLGTRGGGGAREFRQLSEALDRMLLDLRDRSRLRDAIAVAAQVQQRLLPPAAPIIRGLDVHGFSAYCDETGGDYFDFIPLCRNGREGLLVAMGDVVGHGIGSALVMAGARGVLRSRTSECRHVGELMTHLNDQLVPDLSGTQFLTMLLLHIDPDDGSVHWSNAGHDPAIIYDPSTGEFSETGRGSIPLGIEGELKYEELPFGPVRAGQVIVLGTDGVWETANSDGEFFGKDRLKAIIRATPTSTAAAIAGAVRRELDSFRGSMHQRDDVTLVIVKVLEVGANESSITPLESTG